MRTRILLPVLLLAALSARAEPALRILFIGNSLTYTNDLPSMVGRIAAADGRYVSTATIALPNYSLEDHLGTADVRAALRQRWDIVVLQQGPSSLDESRVQLIRDVKAFAGMIRPPTRIAVLMVWPGRDYWRSLDRVAESHRLAADAVSATLIPAGTAMQAALARDPTLALFGADGFHPDVIGSYLAALVTYRALIGPLPRDAALQRVARNIAGAEMKLTNAQLGVVVGVAGVH
jgi:hypothetical protein